MFIFDSLLIIYFSLHKYKTFLSSIFIFVENCNVYMEYYCKLSDKSRMDKSKYKHFRSKTHDSLENTIIKRDVFQNIIINQKDEIMNKYINN